MFSARCRAAAAKRSAQGRNSGARRSGMSSTPPKANSSRQNPNKRPQEGRGSTNSAAMWPGVSEAGSRHPRLGPVEEQYVSAFAGERIGDGRTDHARAHHCHGVIAYHP